MGRQESDCGHTSPLSRLEALANRTGMWRWQERLEILSLCLDTIKEVSRKRRERLPLLEHCSQGGWCQQVGLDTELVSDDRYGNPDI